MPYLFAIKQQPHKSMLQIKKQEASE